MVRIRMVGQGHEALVATLEALTYGQDHLRPPLHPEGTPELQESPTPGEWAAMWAPTRARP